MDKTLNMGAFEALDQQEMMEVDGGGWLSTCLKVVGFCTMVVGACIGSPPLIVGGAVLVAVGDLAKNNGY